MPTLRLFATIRVAAGVGKAEMEGETVADVLANATLAYGAGFAELIPSCRIWVNGESAEPDTPVSEGDEVALLPPVSGG
ncbi:MAG: MoaD/ThiS family protein [Acidimicrobiales bacterium]|nr:MoaD/ThiS family protein [Acidimicrobiales bacterium]RZV46600.1 MAG: MoaD/ThiS family protein [Acidimicrobiales bacterium]